jgi:protein TonB
MFKRYATAVAVGALVTLGVLFTMQALVVAPRGRLDESGSRHFVDFVRVEREETLERKDHKREKPTEPDLPPPDITQRRVDSAEQTEFTIDVPAPSVDVDMSTGNLGLGDWDSEYQPIVKIKPQYPMVARTRGIEGHCTVRYTVTTSGTVKDVVVIDAKPRGIFDRVSVQAALKFKYRPRVINGEAVEVPGVTNQFLYILEN